MPTKKMNTQRIPYMLAFHFPSKISLELRAVIKSISSVRFSRSFAIMRDDKIPTGNTSIGMENEANAFVNSFLLLTCTPKPVPQHTKTTNARNQARAIANSLVILGEDVSFQKIGESVTGGRFIKRSISKAASWSGKTSLYRG